jgi:hypothetical protein
MMPADSLLFRVRKKHEYSVRKEAAVPLDHKKATAATSLGHLW